MYPVVQSSESEKTGTRKAEQKPKLVVKEVVIENFKSIKNISLKLRKGITVLAGANNTGKTNILEAIAFLSRALVKEADKTPYAPHYPPYASGIDLLWARNIEHELGYTIKIAYECTVDSRRKKRLNGEVRFKFSFVYEPSLKTVVPSRLVLDFRDGYKLVVSSDGIVISSPIAPDGDKLVNHRIGVPLSYRSILYSLRGLPAANKTKVSIENGILKVSHDIQPVLTSIIAMMGELEESRNRSSLEKIEVKIEDRTGITVNLFHKLGDAKIINKKRIEKCMSYVTPLFLGFYLVEWLSRVVFIRYIDRAKLTSPHPPSDNSYLSEDASNLPEVLERYRSKTGQMPPTLDFLIREEFPGYKVWTSISENWLISLNAEENGIKIPAVSMPSGLLKTMAVAVAVDLKPSILLIDEIENSLHPRLMKRILDVLQEKGISVVVATHSPTVLDLIEADRIMIVARKGVETLLKNFSEKAEILKALEEQGLSVGEYVSYVETWEE